MLEILAASHRGVSLAELSRRTKIPKSSLFRILLVLEQNFIVLQDSERKVFTLGMKLVEWGNAALDRVDLKTVSHPHLMRLAHETRESYYVGVLDGHDVILIDRADTPEIWRMVTRLGLRSPVHATASGQVLIANLDPHVIDTIVASIGLKRFTPKTITSPARLKKRLIQVMAQGYAVADAEYKPDLCVVAVPIFDHRGNVAAALMTALQSERVHKKRGLIHSLVAILKKDAAEISHEIGYPGSR